MTDSVIKVIFADDHNLVRKGIISLLDNVENIKVVGEAENGYELVSKFTEFKPDVVITDISMPQLSGTEAVRMIKEHDNNAKALFLSMYGGEDYVIMTLNAGGLGLIDKSIAKEDLIKAIEAVYKNEMYFGSEYDDEKIESLKKKFSVQKKEISEIAESITSREMEILKFVCDGLSCKEIGEKIKISIRTVESHKSSIMHKFGVTTSTQLIKFAIENRLV